MDISFNIKYDDGVRRFNGLDAYYGAQSLFAITQIMLICFNAFLNKEIVTKATAAKGFWLVAGPARKGSWEQLLHMVITDPHLISLAEEYGKQALYDLTKWAMGGAVGIPFILKNRKAKNIIKELRKKNEDLLEKLDDAVLRAHAPVKHQGLNVHIMSGRTVLMSFNHETLEFIETEVIEDETYVISLAVNRFNARTGTGRFIEAIDSISIPFWPYEELSERQKVALADNLAKVARGVYDPLNVIVSNVVSRDGRLKRYRLHGVAI
ncbi:hypothetical protein [Magnetospirillum fulvum]|uniref:DUF7946 domain-containing protein n=1 Tax=Magnetospirillum fulvum TaxID=1082 RepID=A0A1H6H5R3_MAGFU|nr:hypothetical protein [Magnetospirillum fulvum]SEH31177.1 hypothetical protein SAMN04244559_01091 [Magnetospirillum fulvum]